MEEKPEAPLDLGDQSNQCIKSVKFTISSEVPSLAFITIPLDFLFHNNDIERKSSRW